MTNQTLVVSYWDISVISKVQTLTTTLGANPHPPIPHIINQSISTIYALLNQYQGTPIKCDTTHNQAFHNTTSATIS